MLALFLIVVAATTYSTTQARAREVNENVVSRLQLDRTAPARTPVLLAGQSFVASRRLIARPLTTPTTTADECVHPGGDERLLPATTKANEMKLTTWLGTHRDEVSGIAIRAASCRAAIQALRWEPEAARTGIFLSPHPERIGALTYLYAMSGITTPAPAFMRQVIKALSDSSRFQYGAEAGKRFVGLAHLAGDEAAEVAWRQFISQATAGEAATMRPRPAYVDGVISGRLVTTTPGWRVGLLVADEPGPGVDPTLQAPRSEGAILSSMVTATDAAKDGRFTFTGLRDGYYQLAVLSPEGAGIGQFVKLVVRNDPGVFRLDPTRKNKDLGTISLSY